MIKFVLCFALSVCVSSLAFAEEKLIFAIDLVRHGDRTPLIDSREMQKIWPYGTKQLTPKGMRQAYELGKVLRQRYVNEHHLLLEQYDINAMDVRSSNTARTMMTAQSVLFGLYPLGTGPVLNESAKALPQGLQPIPINTVPREQDSLLVPNYDKVKHKQLLETDLFNTPEWIQKDKWLQPNYVNWGRALGTDITSLFDLIHVSDRLYVEKLYGIDLPVGLHVKDAEMIMDAGKWALLRIFNHPKFALVGGSKLAQTIKQEISLAAEQKRALKYLLFVAHDTTLSAQLNLLGQQIDDVPPYVSDIHYALFDMGASNYEVRVTYNQKPLYIEQCGGISCTLDEFVSLIDSKLQDLPETITG
ncbi:MAG: histidine phosphatase family protein [Legionellaceae bacterium]|nr:histidine phosphatase family protein [Legionellaceae bacterium]